MNPVPLVTRAFTSLSILSTIGIRIIQIVRLMLLGYLIVSEGIVEKWEISFDSEAAIRMNA